MSKSTVNMIGIIANIVAIAGIVCFFCGLRTVTVICAVITIIDSFIQIRWGDQNNFVTEIIAAIVGVFVALFTKTNIVHLISVVLCIWCIVALLFGWIYLIVITRKCK